MSRSFKLFRLQQFDSQIDAANNRLNEIAAILGNNQLLQQAQDANQQAEQLLQTAQKELRRAEQQTLDQRRKIRQNSERLYGGTVKNPKELQDLQQEGEALQRYLEVLEERQLEAMLEVDEAENEFRQSQKRLDTVQAELVESHAALKGEQSQLDRDRERWIQERNATAETIPDEDLSLYQKRRTTRGGIAVTAVRGQTCGACGTRLSSALHQSARSSTRLAFCDTCGRILYIT